MKQPKNERLSQTASICQFALELTCCSLGGALPAPSRVAGWEDAQWDALLHECIRQGVVLHAAESLRRADIPVPPECAERFLLAAAQITVQNDCLLKLQRALVRILTKEAIPFVILKGACTASAYPDPAQRMLGDVDFLIAPSDRQRTNAALTAHGFSLSHAGENPWHDSYRFRGYTAEMHFCIPGLPAGKKGDKLRAFFSDLPQSSSPCRIGADTFPVPVPAQQALILLLHIQKHMQNDGIGLRQLADWSAFCRKYETAPFWSALLPLLHAEGLYRFAAVLCRLCTTCLNGALPPGLDGGEDALCDALLEDIFTGGEFGRKAPGRADAGALITGDHEYDGSHGGLYHTAVMAKRFVRRRYPIVDRCPLLYLPLLPWCALLRLGMVLRGRRHGYFQMLAHMRRRRRLYRRMHLFQKEPAQRESSNPPGPS